MKKISYLALALITMTLFACSTKPAESDQQANEEEYFEETNEEAIEILEAEMAEAEETPAEEPAAEETPAEEPAEEPAAEEPAEEPTAEEPAPVAETPAAPSDKFEIRGSDGNYVAFVSEIITADANRCIPLNMVMDKKEESRVRLVIQIERLDGTKIGVFPVGIEPGGTKANSQFCPPAGGVFDGIQAGEQYKLSFVRAQLQ